MAAPQWQALYEVLLEEVLVRLPPDDPASLLHAALVCKRWARVVSGRGFRARLRGFHGGGGGGGGPPMLGFLCDLRGDRDDGAVSRFVPTSTFRPRPTELRGWRAADARHGRVLIYPLRKRFAAGSRTPELTVCVPATGELRRLPASPRPRPSSWSAALLCGCDGDHRPGCHDGDGPFRVVLVGTTDKDGIFSSVYSSVDDAWSEAAASPVAHPDSSPTCLESVPGVHVGNALHFLFQGSASILRYDLDSREVSLIQRPPACTYYQGRPLLMTMEDGKLGFAAVNHSTLSLWPREVGDDGQARWGQSRVIGLETLLSDEDLFTLPYLLDFAHDVGVLFLWTAVGGLFLVNMKSGRVEKFEIDRDIYGVVPFVSYCIPALKIAPETDGGRASA